jgi:hypothetical protein
MIAAARRLTIALVGLLALAAPLVGCRATPQATPGPRGPVDRSLLTGDPCEPPCWQGLTPRISTEAEVDEFLRTSELVAQPTIHWGYLYNGAGEPVALQASWRSAGYTVGEFYLNSASVDDGLLRSIEIHLDYDATLEEVLERYGLPYKLWSRPAGTHDPFALVNLYYPECGLSVQVEVLRHDAELRPDSPVTEVCYFAPVTRERFLDEAYELGIPMTGDLENWLWDWQGYGPVDW